MKIDVLFWLGEEHLFGVTVDNLPPYREGQEIYLELEAPEEYKSSRILLTGYKIIDITHSVSLQYDGAIEFHRLYKMEVMLEKLNK